MVVPSTFTSIPEPSRGFRRLWEVAWVVVVVVACFVRGFVVGGCICVVVVPGCRSVTGGRYAALLPLLDSFT